MHPDKKNEPARRPNAIDAAGYHQAEIMLQAADRRGVFKAVGRIAEQPSPEYCSIPSLRSDVPLVNGT